MASSSTARQASSLDGICGTVNTTEDVPLREHRERHPIDQLGWQSAGFYAFGNGVLANGTWYPVDEYGIVRLPELGNQYLPALSLSTSTTPSCISLNAASSIGIRKLGCTHLTLEILRHRPQFESNFREAYNRTFDDLRVCRP